MRAREESGQFDVSERIGAVSTILLRPDDARALYVLAHGAGAGMRHRFMEAIAQSLAESGVATFRYQFPYVEKGLKRPDPPGILHATVRAANAHAAALAPDLPRVAGGKSLGGRMTSQAQAKEALEGVHGLLFLGFPLHAPGRDGTERAAHLEDVALPMLFLQGTRDTLANLDLMKEVTGELGEQATLHVVEGGDHSFNVLKRAGRTPEQVMDELCHAAVSWIDRVVA